MQREGVGEDHDNLLRWTNKSRFKNRKKRTKETASFNGLKLEVYGGMRTRGAGKEDKEEDKKRRRKKKKKREDEWRGAEGGEESLNISKFQ